MLTKSRDTSTPSSSMYGRNRHRRPSPLLLIGISVPVLLAIIAVSVIVVLPRLNSHAATAVINPNCTLVVPANALTAQGLATPYQLFAPDAAANGACNEANPTQGAFVQATIYDPATGAFSVYNPLVIDQGTQPAVVPTAPTLPANAVVGLWFGFNGTNLTLQGAQQDANVLAQAQCANGLNGSIFGQFSYCNAPNFFAAVNQGIANGLVKIPALGMANDGKPCPTTRDFSVVDQDQSDNVQTQYLANANGQTAQLTAANQAQLANATVLGNPSDNALVTRFIDPALGCQPWQAPDLANAGTMTLSLAMDEIQANALQQAPIALVPLTDPMVLVNNAQSQDKTILYRKGVDQNPGNILPTDGTTYCQNYLNVGLPHIQGDMTITINRTSPDPAAANSLFTFLANRFMQAYTLLNCPNLLNQPNPVTVQMNGNGVVTAATIKLPGAAAGGATGGTTTGGAAQAATGNATITLNPAAGNATLTSTVTYPNHPNQQINLNVVKRSCKNKPFFTRAETTDANSQNMANALINNLQGRQKLPANWFFTVTDPAQNNAVVACAPIVANGTTGTATLAGAAAGTGAGAGTGTPVAATGTVTATATAVAGTGAPATGTATPTVQPTAPASAGQTTPKNAPYKGKRRQHGLW
ncbi:hypothetical protein [Dictyobacter arantiisoli]|uniref:Uncharacterized protein n=1 Tax=Dictyobacter arantiisoli TaxID=2014874 RepID=A0A5A5THB2_9CHLR|nr:hypothetical protein [Dictyobacter arantiisoli]GCF10453.1 hypothetical protein KDI_40170 [Dictyobacter arantiisoli]